MASGNTHLAILASSRGKELVARWIEANYAPLGAGGLHEFLARLLELEENPGDQMALRNATRGWRESGENAAPTIDNRSCRKLEELLSPHVRGPVVADIGCGPNLLNERLMLGSSGIQQAIGLDLRSPNRTFVPGVSFVSVSHPNAIDLPDDTVDTVMLTSALHCMDIDLAAYVDEIARVLRCRGRVLVVEDTFSNSLEPVVYDYKTAIPELSTLFRELTQDQQLDFLRFVHWFTSAAASGNWDDPSLVTPGSFLTIEEWTQLFNAKGYRTMVQEYLLGFFNRPAGFLGFERSTH